MFLSRFSRLTAMMIYGGTFLLSVLSFFTTYFGLTILVDAPLAIIGSLGLQAAMLGIAWNLIKIRDNRKIYVTVFFVTACFSIFFSFANFDSSLQNNTRAMKAHHQYATLGRSTLSDYSSLAREARSLGDYQVSRLEKLKQLEEEKGWATAIDEGSGDEFIQSVIDGARLMTDSWKEHQGSAYNQGSGRGIIVDYLESRQSQAINNLKVSQKYISILDTISLSYSSELTVAEQYQLINRACVEFPTGVIAGLTSRQVTLPLPPDPSLFVEIPANRQQAFTLVISDLLALDSLAIFSMLLAIAIDLIVILIALAGSYAFDDEDHVFLKARHDAMRRLQLTSDDSTADLDMALHENIKQFERASEYGLDLQRVLEDYKTKKKKFKFTLNKSGETSSPPTVSTSQKDTAVKPARREKIVI